MAKNDYTSRTPGILDQLKYEIDQKFRTIAYGNGEFTAGMVEAFNWVQDLITQKKRELYEN